MFNVLKGYTFTEGIKSQRFLEGAISNRVALITQDPPRYDS